MHGRLKVKTTAEQQEAKRKEREKKLQLYNAATKKLFKKRASGEYDEDMLTLTGEMLGANPDFYTLWNVRREVLSKFKEEKTTEELNALFKTELSFLEHCLQVNPKSYGTWQHRCWVMDNMPEPNWARDLMLCNKFLEMDERNFHCWDYRRFVVQRSAVPAKDEFDYTTQKIATNFSNFSSWHYRSKLMPHLYPDENHPVGVQEETLLKEFELVQNAFFTDPSDQSAWFYHKWLLGRRERPLSIDTLYFNRTFQRLTVVLSISAKPKVFSITVNEEEVNVRPTPLPSCLDHSQLWICDLPAPDGDLRIQVQVGDCTRCVRLGAGQDEAWCHLRQEGKLGNLFSLDLSAATTSVLDQELDSCQQLHELEPDNKWAMLTILSLMRALDPIKYEPESLKYIEKLKEVDPCRTNYYMDLRSKYVIENAIERLAVPSDKQEQCLDLTDSQLTTLYHQNHMTLLTHLDISRNAVSSFKNCHFLQRLRILKASAMKISNCRGLENLQSLEELDISNNYICDIEDLQPLTTCPKLRLLDIRDMPVCEVDELRKKMTVMLPGLTHLNGEPV